MVESENDNFQPKGISKTWADYQLRRLQDLMSAPDDVFTELRAWVAIQPDPPPNRCSRCGISEDDTDWGSLTDVEVIIANGEEGFADIKQFLCEDHLRSISEGLMALGFKDHRHDGIDFLEDGDCEGSTQGMDDCPTPSAYGVYHVGNPHLNEDADD